MNTKQKALFDKVVQKCDGDLVSALQILDMLGEEKNEAAPVEEVNEEIGMLMRGGSAIIYASGNDPYAVIEQIKRGFRYAADNGMEVVQVATTIDELDEILQTVDIDVLLVRDHSRLSRDAIGRLQALMVLEQLGIELHVIGK